MTKEYKKKEPQKNISTDLSKSVPPQAIDIEQNILGAMLVDNKIIDKVLELLKSEMFYSSANRKIFENIKNMFVRSNPVDIITLMEELRKNSELEEVGGVSFIYELRNNLASAANIEYYCKIIIEKYMLRELIGASLDTARKCYQSSEDTFDILDDAEKRIFEISENKFKKTFTPISTLLKSTMDIVQSAVKKKSLPGLKTGYDRFDQLTGGFQKSDLIIIAARPGMGKTALGLSIARNMASYDIPVGFFSLEMTGVQIMLRLLSAEAKIEGTKLRTGYLAHDDEAKLSRAFRKLSGIKMYVDDTSTLNVLELRAKARRLIREHDVKIIFVDYLQLMQGPQNYEREREISFISRSLKGLAKELDIPIVALAQLNRQIEGRPNKSPLLSDLRESGAIEQDADMVCFIHRPFLYKADKANIEPGEENIADIIIAKQRNGPTDEFKLVFIKEYTRFENKSDQDLREIVAEEKEEPNF